MPNDASADQIAEAVQAEVDQIVAEAQQQNIPLFLSEVGTTSQEGSITHTGRWDHRTPVDQTIQSHYYQAVCQTWKRHVDGVYWWNTALHPIAQERLPEHGGFDPIGKEAAEFMSCSMPLSEATGTKKK